jgi:putative ubiquitin-RnfH superfamily antitoxin RatB of RatAB toxin-antitoxin module
MNAGDFRKRCIVAYATCERQYLWTVDLRRDASVADALEEAQREAQRELAAARQSSSSETPLIDPDKVPWATAAVGIFGEPCERTAIPLEGDRIEIYRVLPDPRARRRALVQRERKPR